VKIEWRSEIKFIRLYKCKIQEVTKYHSCLETSSGNTDAKRSGAAIAAPDLASLTFTVAVNS